MAKYNKFVPYYEPSIQKAKELVKNEKDNLKKFTLITNWVSKSFAYDYVRALTIPKYGRETPDVESCWNNHMGICMDVASMTTGMLRGVGVPAYMCFGHADKSYHAWVEATINGKTYRFDNRSKAKKYKREKVF